MQKSPAQTHGLSGIPEYRVYAAMKDRCYLKTCKDYHYYGGRGIVVCDRWLHSFECFITDLGRRPSPAHQLDRENNNGSYCPENCRWVVRRVQARNKRNTVILEFNGEKMPLGDWADRLGKHPMALHSRLNRGWSVERTLSTPWRQPVEPLLLEHGGKKMTVAQWAQSAGITVDNLRLRLRYGWSLGRALSQKARRRSSNKDSMVERANAIYCTTKHYAFP